MQVYQTLLSVYINHKNYNSLTNPCSENKCTVGIVFRPIQVRFKLFINTSLSTIAQSTETLLLANKINLNNLEAGLSRNLHMIDSWMDSGCLQMTIDCIGNTHYNNLLAPSNFCSKQNFQFFALPNLMVWLQASSATDSLNRPIIGSLCMLLLS